MAFTCDHLLMAHDDPQKRIVDLERQPAEQNRGAGRRKRNRILLSANVTAVVIALAAAMLVIVISACGANSLSGSRHSVRVAAVKGQPSADAMATLMNQGFKVRRLPKPDSTVAPDYVIDTQPAAGETAEQGSEVVVNVSTGPEQRTIPDVSNHSFAEARNILTAAGFGTVKQVPTPSLPSRRIGSWAPTPRPTRPRR